MRGYRGNPYKDLLIMSYIVLGFCLILRFLNLYDFQIIETIQISAYGIFRGIAGIYFPENHIINIIFISLDILFFLSLLFYKAQIKYIVFVL